jgi:hypothetical protein
VYTHAEQPSSYPSRRSGLNTTPTLRRAWDAMRCRESFDRSLRVPIQRFEEIAHTSACSYTRAIPRALDGIVDSPRGPRAPVVSGDRRCHRQWAAEDTHG